jgi:GT2 family glycosyltransferase
MRGKGAVVSVIVVNFNGRRYVEKCLSSVLNQDYPRFELILVDNNSTDGSASYVRQRFPQVLVVENKENLGYSAGINSGISRASGDYLAPLNVDTEVERDWLAPMVEFLEGNPDVGAVTPKSLLYTDRSKIGVQGLNIHVTGLAFVRGLNEQDSRMPQDPFPVAGVSGCSFVIRREIVEQMGGLNEHNFMYYDDVDLSWMVNLMGYSVYCVPRSVVYHEYELRMTPQKMYWLEYGRWSSVVCYLRPSTFVVLLPVLAFTELLIAGYCFVRGPGYMLAKLRSCGRLLVHTKRVMARRRKAQGLRKLSDWELLKRFTLRYEWRQALHILRVRKHNEAKQA